MANKNFDIFPVEKITGAIVQLPGEKKNGRPGYKGNIRLPRANTVQAVGESPAVNDAAQPAENRYATQNERVWTDGYEGYERYLENERKSMDPRAATKLDDSEYHALMKDLAVDPVKISEAGKRAMEGSSGADEDLLSDAGYAMIQSLKAEWDHWNELAKEAEAAGDADAASVYREKRDEQNVYANRIRAGAGYYGGTDGSMYVPLSQLERESHFEESIGGTSGGFEKEDHYADNEDGRMKALLDAWQEAAQQQNRVQIDHAVQQAVSELEHALQDAQMQFKEQAESVALEERQAMDNSALYAELRGDRGGIGQEQYNSVQNAAAYNRLAVQQAQTKLATDTARQIEQLRVQGEFDKANAALEITQEYLSQLMSLERWAAEFEMDTAKFMESLEQWEAEYRLALEKMYQSGK